MLHTMLVATRRVALLALVLFAPVAAANGQEVAPGKVKVFVLAGQSNMEGHGQVRSLAHLGEHPEHGQLLSRLQAPDGTWATRDDVFITWQAYGQPRRDGPLTVGQGANENAIGPELMFGTIVGDRFEEPVLLIKVAWGGKDVHCDFRSPSAGVPDGDAARRLAAERAKGQEREVGAYYRRMLSEIRDALARIDEIVPGAGGAGYELAGFVWFQGWSDYCQWHEYPGITDDYPRHLAAMVRDLRTDLGAPKLPIAIGELGVGGEEMRERAADERDREARAIMRFRDAQRAVLDEPGMDGVVFVPTADCWDRRLDELRRMSDRWANEKREKGIASTAENQLPTKELNDEYLRLGGHWYCHYNGSAATYCLIGHALAQACLDAVGDPR